MPRLLVIDDDAVDRKAVARALKALGDGYQLREAHDGRQGVALAVAESFDCILVDYNLPDMNGLDLLAELREHTDVAAPIVMLTGSGDESVAVEAMKRGADDYLPKSRLEPAALARVVSSAIDNHSRQNRRSNDQQELERLAMYDSLTGLGNRNLFHLLLTRAIATAQRKDVSFVLMMIDLDRFKLTNDTYGHGAGDAILAAVGRRLRGIARAADAYFRLGGDEFTAILDSGSDGASAARRILTAIAEPVPYGRHSLAVNASVGLATFPADGDNAADLIRAADVAMYAEKKTARI